MEPEARAAFVWILGEYGQSIQVPPWACPPASPYFCDAEMEQKCSAHMPNQERVIPSARFLQCIMFHGRSASGKCLHTNPA